MSRCVAGKDGDFRGVVAGAIRFSYFHDLFGGLRLNTDDGIGVMRRDGIMVMRTPFALDVIGRHFSPSPLVKAVMAEQSGAISFVRTTDGISRLCVWRDRNKPLVVLVGNPAPTGL